VTALHRLSPSRSRDSASNSFEDGLNLTKYWHVITLVEPMLRLAYGNGFYTLDQFFAPKHIIDVVRFGRVLLKNERGLCFSPEKLGKNF
jgi:hypothetical protein